MSGDKRSVSVDDVVRYVNDERREMNKEKKREESESESERERKSD